MRAVFILWSLLAMAAVTSSLPNTPRRRPTATSRTIARNPSPPSAALSPAADTKLTPQTATTPRRTRPRAPSPPRVRSRPGAAIRPKSPVRPTTPPSGGGRLQTPAQRAASSPRTSATEAVIETVTESVTAEVREVGVNGWLAAPTQAPVAPLARTEPPPKPDKPGLCEAPKGFGVKCMSRMDQCSLDQHCPGATKCCMVGECGYLCVKPKPTSNEAKQPVKQTIKKNNNKSGVKAEVGPAEIAAEAESRTIEVAVAAQPAGEGRREGDEEEGSGNDEQKTHAGEGGLTTTTKTGTPQVATTSSTTPSAAATTTKSSDDGEEGTEDTLESRAQP